MSGRRAGRAPVAATGELTAIRMPSVNASTMAVSVMTMGRMRSQVCHRAARSNGDLRMSFRGLGLLEFISTYGRTCNQSQPGKLVWPKSSSGFFSLGYYVQHGGLYHTGALRSVSFSALLNKSR